MNRLNLPVGTFGLLFIIQFLGLGCEPSSSLSEASSQVEPGLTQLTRGATLAECPNGGVTLDKGSDQNQNGVLDPAEVSGNYVLCHGKDGKDGVAGINGANGIDGANANRSGALALLEEIDQRLNALEPIIEANTAKVGISADQSASIEATASAIASIDWSRFECAAGFAGIGCVYSDAEQCDDHGSVASDGTCTCTPPWVGDDCSLPPPEMAEIPEGEYLKGNPQIGAIPSNLETATLPSFYIDIHLVTADEYEACVASGNCMYYGPTSNSDPEHNSIYRTYQNGKGNHPINFVRLGEAKEYCAWKGKRLPTSAEWEKAARGTDGRTFPWGDAPLDSSRANFDDGSIQGTTPVGYYNGVNSGTIDSPSPYGLYDMTGNVQDMTSTSPCSGMNQWAVARGGSFESAAISGGIRLMAFYENCYNWLTSSGQHSGSTGFRCAL